MPTPTFQAPQGEQSTAQLQDWIVKLVRDLNYLLGNLDTVNINRLDAKVIIAQTITALQIAAGTITATEIMAGTITADKLTVSQLSAISANLGTILAGSITSNATINVGTDLNVGKSIYMNAGSFQATIYFTPSVYIYFDPAALTLKMVAPNGVYANAKRIDI